jgi:glycine cleavage system H lipoate-binding protein
MILIFAFALIGLLLLGMLGLFLLGKKSYEVTRHLRMGLQEVRSFLLHPGLYYHPGHTWVMPQRDGTVRIGLDDFGRRLVDGIRKVNLPRQGSAIVEGEVAVQLDCGGKHAKLLSPVDGKVTAVNKTLTRNGLAPVELEQDPYGKGWLFTVRVPDQRFTRLPTGADSMEWLKEETGRLSLVLHSELGVTIADGGELVSKPPAMLSEEQWEALTRAFFHTS